MGKVFISKLLVMNLMFAYVHNVIHNLEEDQNLSKNFDDDLSSFFINGLKLIVVRVKNIDTIGMSQIVGVLIVVKYFFT